MKILKRILFSILLLLICGILFRGWLYRNLVTYKSIGHRSVYIANNDSLIHDIEAFSNTGKETNVKLIISQSLFLTSEILNFTDEKNENDPNKLIYSKTAHCVGYASFFATSCNYLLKKYHLDKDWTATPQIGQLYFLGTNIHNYLNNSFLKDHDFVLIENKTTGEKFAVDPTINDYLSIDFITLQ